MTMSPTQFGQLVTAVRQAIATADDQFGAAPSADRTSGAQAHGARELLRARHAIYRFFDERLFADPAFDILLDLFASQSEGRQVQTGHLSQAARIPETTALRWAVKLEREGLIVRTADVQDGRRTLVKLTDPAHSAVASYVDHILGRPPSFASGVFAIR